jgi:hypothetical protein
MANEKPQDAQAKKPVRIDDLPETTPGAQDASVKGGMISSGGTIGSTDPDDGDELGGGE